MKNKFSKLKRLAITAGLVTALFSAVGCGCNMGTTYSKPSPPQIWEAVDTTESAVLVPLVGDTKAQATTQTEDYYSKNMVYTKSVQIPHVWRETDLVTHSGKWVPSMRLIKVDRKLVNRTWTKDPGTGTSVADQAIEAEDLNSISFRAHITCTAGIDEPDVPKFLFRFKQADLEHVMDTNIRPLVAELFVAECNGRTMADILKNRGAIMERIRRNVLPQFKSMGVDIQVLGLVGELVYVDPTIQKSINAVFTANQEKSAAAAKAEAARLLATPANMDYMRLQLEQRKLEIEMKKAEKWDGKNPTTVLGGNSSPMVMLNPSK